MTVGQRESSGWPLPRATKFLPADADISRVPPHLYRRRRNGRDPLLLAAKVLVDILVPANNYGSWRRGTESVDRTTLLRVVDRTVVAHDQAVVALTFERADGGPLARWSAGAHLDLLLPSGRMREYSLCGDPGDTTRYRIAVRKIPDGGGGSVEVHEHLQPGSVIRVRGPRNGMPFAVPGYGSPMKAIRFIAGGIGITPILPMMQIAERLGIEWSMCYAGRSLDTIPFVDEVAAYGDKVTVRTDDQHGLPTLADLVGETSVPTAVYACGPGPMLTTLRAGLVGRTDVELHYERFGAPPVLDGKPFAVTLARSGTTVAVDATESALAAILKANLTAPYSCKQGFCGTCRVKVLAGEVDHRDALLTSYERDQGQMLTCVSRAAGDEITVDL